MNGHFFVKILFIWFILLGVCLNISCGVCGDTCRIMPGEPSSQILHRGNRPEPNFGEVMASAFRDHVSAVDGDRCPSLPSCSSYSVMAFKKHGCFIGWVMTVDRLIHEGDEASVSPVVYYYGRGKILDPVENNDFWWFLPNEKIQD